MLSLGWAKSCQVEPMLVDLVLKRRYVEAISVDFQCCNKGSKGAFQHHQTLCDITCLKDQAWLQAPHIAKRTNCTAADWAKPT